MKVDATLSKDILATKAQSAAFEAAGYDGVCTGETSHDVFLQLLQAADATERTTITSSIAIAFARNPMNLASIGFDLNLYSGGRFVLGLGSQIKPHIERRFSMPWSHPAPRMREMVLAIRAIWDTWQNGTKLNFQGDFYNHTLMTPFFSPEPSPHGLPPIMLAGVGAMMTDVAGEVCDGFFIHAFSTEKYLRETTVPALERGRAKAGKTLDGFTIAGPCFITAARTEEGMAEAVKGTKNQIAFYASTPAYRPVLEAHGWGDLQAELTAMTKEGRWSEIGSRISDEMMHAFSVVGTPDEVGKGIVKRLGGIAQRTGLYTTYEPEPGVLTEVLESLRNAQQ
ncbi:MAG: putative N5,N10-methylenetetrahydromethanopterin reductase-related protein [Acidimicrobiia bacterium]|nr:putative N5,N10-methylenetetrahydromethanopterin reductase-related protein [Acidimicrobiia bacterium]